MKYLKIHTAIWAVFCAFLTLIVIIIYIFINIISFLWRIKLMSWSDVFSDEDYAFYHKKDGGLDYRCEYHEYKNPKESFCKLYNLFNNENL